MNIRDWAEIGNFTIHYSTIVPHYRAEVIRRQYPSGDDQKRQGAQYYITVYPLASWEDLAGMLYECEEHRAIKTFKDVLPKPKGNQCDCVECVGAVCSDSVHSAL